MKKKHANHQSPVDHQKEFPLQYVKFRHGNAAHLGVEIVCTKCVTEAFAGDSDGCNDKAMTSEG